MHAYTANARLAPQTIYIALVALKACEMLMPVRHKGHSFVFTYATIL